MKPMTLNMSNLKKISGDDKSSTFKHPDGHTMKIAHAPLSVLQRKQIEKMPIHNFDEGGDVSSDQDRAPASDTGGEPISVNPNPSSLNIPQHVNTTNLADNLPYGYSQSIQGQQAQESAPISNGSTSNIQPESAPNNVSGQAAVGNAPLGAMDSVTEGRTALKEQKNIDIAKAASNKAAADALLLGTQEIGKNATKYTNDMIAQQNALRAEMSDPKNAINPNHYQESLSTPQKISHSIGLLLGGFSSAFTHQANPALQEISAQIDRDIESQKARADQKKTLFGANQSLFNDEIAATNFTRVNLNDTYLNQIRSEAARLGTPQAIQAYHAAEAKFGLENAGLIQQTALRMGALKAMNEGTAQPESLVPYLVPEAHQKDADRSI